MPLVFVADFLSFPQTDHEVTFKTSFLIIYYLPAWMGGTCKSKRRYFKKLKSYHTIIYIRITFTKRTDNLHKKKKKYYNSCVWSISKIEGLVIFSNVNSHFTMNLLKQPEKTLCLILNIHLPEEIIRNVVFLLEFNLEGEISA